MIAEVNSEVVAAPERNSVSVSQRHISVEVEFTTHVSSSDLAGVNHVKSGCRDFVRNGVKPADSSC